MFSAARSAKPRHHVLPGKGPARRPRHRPIEGHTEAHVGRDCGLKRKPGEAEEAKENEVTQMETENEGETDGPDASRLTGAE